MTRAEVPCRLKTAIALTLALAVVACDERVRVYPIRRVDPPIEGNIKWIPLNPSTYRISASGEVVKEILGSVTKYEDCAVLDARNWKCTYSKRSSDSFGMRDGSFWTLPTALESAGWEIQYVSRLEYNLVRCQVGWAAEPTWFGRVARCVWYWE